MELISTTEAAERLGISVATLNRRAANGAVPIVTQGPGPRGVRMYDAEVIAALHTTTYIERDQR